MRSQSSTLIILLFYSEHRITIDLQNLSVRNEDDNPFSTRNITESLDRKEKKEVKKPTTGMYTQFRFKNLWV